MFITILVLLVSALLGGLSLNLFPNAGKKLRSPLIFAGSYLFSITIIHIIPEIFSTVSNPSRLGLYILFGFFLQQFLEYFSSGVEHGHIHSGKAITSTGQTSIVVALIIHSLLEGALLTHDSPFHEKHESYSLLIGIALHKIPAGFALMATMKSTGKKALLYLLIFSIASPIGFVFSELVIVNEAYFLVLFAIVCGSFLHISTTIFVETSPNHRFGPRKMLISLAGALLAIFAEFVV
ncbi:MAG: ZIP family metal transporter [Bacteroidota bacterium]